MNADPSQRSTDTNTSQAATVPKLKVWTGRSLTVLATLFMVFDGVIHTVVPAPVVEAFHRLGYPTDDAVILGILELACLALYVIPQTSVLGAILLTGYLGGAVAIQVRIQAPLFSTALFPVYVGIFLWGGLYLRDDRLRAMIPVRKLQG